MYRVYADGVLIHDDSAYNLVANRLISPSLSLKDNSSGAFTATIPIGNVCYDSIRCFDTTIDVFRHNQNGSDTWIWSGRPLKISKDFYNQKKLTAEGVLSFLNDIVVPLGKLYRLDLPQYIRFLLDIYNMHVASNRRITAGGVSTISSTGKGTGFHDYEFDGDNVLSYLSKVLEDWGLHARIRRTGNSYSSPGYVLDLVTDSQLPMSRQTVNFGKNLLDYTSDDDWSELVTAILPYGATIEEESSGESSGSGEESGENDSSQQSQQSQQQEEDDAPKPKYTIFGLQPSNPKFYADGAYLVNRVMENIHGRIEQTVEWSDIKDPVELLALAEAYLNDYTYMTQKLTVKVIDLHYLTGSNEIAFDFLSQINCFSSIHGLNDTFIVKEMTIPFDNPENTSFTMNRETRGYYGADRKSGGGYSSKISATSWHIPAREGILRVARENAEALINMMTSGYVTLVPTEDGDHVWALTVTNGVDEASSTQMWKWTLGGLMFQERSSVSADWGLPNLALTMDGQIVATRITTGTLAIDDGQGGYLILANMDTGTLQIGSFDVTGTSIYNTKRSVDDDYTKGIYIGFDGIAIGEMNSGLFKVDVYNDIALIAGFNFNGDSIYKDKTSLDDDSVAGVYIGTDGISVGDESNGLFKVDTSNNTAFIAGFNFDDGSFYTNNRSSLQGSGDGVYLGTDGISTGDANGLYTALANGYLSGGPSSESGYISFNTVNTENNQNGIRVAGRGCVAILTDGAFGVGAYTGVDGAANFYEGVTTSISIPSISGGYKYYTYKLDVTWKDYTISDTSFKVPTEIKLTPTEATGTFDNVTSTTYEFKYGLLNTKNGSGEGGSGSGSGSGSGGSGSGSGEGGSGSGSGSGTHAGTPGTFAQSGIVTYCQASTAEHTLGETRAYEIDNAAYQQFTEKLFVDDNDIGTKDGSVYVLTIQPGQQLTVNIIKYDPDKFELEYDENNTLAGIKNISESSATFGNMIFAYTEDTTNSKFNITTSNGFGNRVWTHSVAANGLYTDGMRTTLWITATGEGGSGSGTHTISKSNFYIYQLYGDEDHPLNDSRAVYTPTRFEMDENGCGIADGQAVASQVDWAANDTSLKVAVDEWTHWVLEDAIENLGFSTPYTTIYAGKTGATLFLSNFEMVLTNENNELKFVNRANNGARIFAWTSTHVKAYDVDGESLVCCFIERTESGSSSWKSWTFKDTTPTCPFSYFCSHEPNWRTEGNNILTGESSHSQSFDGYTAFSGGSLNGTSLTLKSFDGTGDSTYDLDSTLTFTLPQSYDIPSGSKFVASGCVIAYDSNYVLYSVEVFYLPSGSGVYRKQSDNRTLYYYSPSSNTCTQLAVTYIKYKSNGAYGEWQVNSHNTREFNVVGNDMQILRQAAMSKPYGAFSN